MTVAVFLWESAARVTTLADAISQGCLDAERAPRPEVTET
jgi:hypothetical protein